MIFYNKYKKFRIENNLDLKDISKRTKIDLKYLQALDRGKFAEIPPVDSALESGVVDVVE